PPRSEHPPPPARSAAPLRRGEVRQPADEPPGGERAPRRRRGDRRGSKSRARASASGTRCGDRRVKGVPSLADPLWLLLLLLLPLLAWHHHRSGSPGALTFSHLPVAASGAWRLHLPFYSRLVAAALLIL